MFSAYVWQPLVLPTFIPVPMRRATVIQLEEPLLLDLDVARFLALGLGRVDMDIKWCWHWSETGVLHAFRSWTGLEVFRLSVRPLGLVPDSPWQAARAEYDADRLPEDDPEGGIRAALHGLTQLQPVLSGVPNGRTTALARGHLPAPAPHYPPQALVDALWGRLPCPATRLLIGEYELPLPGGLLLESVSVDGEAALLSFSDGSRLWLTQSRPAVDPIGVTSLVGGLLLWPHPDWPLPVPVAAWAMTAGTDRQMHHALRDGQGAELSPAAFSPAGDTGLANIVLDLGEYG